MDRPGEPAGANHRRAGEEVKALTLHQPWATFVARGFKTLETRSWRTRHRGLLAIHSSRSVGYIGPEVLGRILQDADLYDDPPFDFPCGSIIGVVTILNCNRVEDVRDLISPRERALGDYSDGRFAWELSNPRLLEKPIPINGQMGVWHVPDVYAAQLMELVA